MVSGEQTHRGPELAAVWEEGRGLAYKLLLVSASPDPAQSFLP